MFCMAVGLPLDESVSYNSKQRNFFIFILSKDDFVFSFKNMKKRKH